MRGRRRGVALLLVMVLLAIGSSMALAFVSAQSTTLAISDNLEKKATARVNAEMALYAVSRYLEAQADWRSLLTEGEVVGGFAGATVTLWDGVDADGDGVVDGDGDLMDDVSDPVTMVVTASLGGVTHRVSRAYWPAIGGGGPVVLMVVGDPDHLTAQEALRRVFLLGEGYGVSLVDSSASSGDLADAVAESDVVYVPAGTSSATIGNKLNDITLGLVTESLGLSDNVGLASTGSTTRSGDSITVVDAAHPVVDGLGLGEIEITNGSSSLAAHTVSDTSDAEVVATAGSDGALLVLETAGIRDDSSVTPARRVVLPWGGSSFDFANLNDAGRDLLVNSLMWSASGGSRIGDARLLAFYNFIQGDPIEPQLLVHWPLDDIPPGGGVAVSDDLKLWNNARIDSYRSSAGVYGGLNQGEGALITTNTTGSNSVESSGGTFGGTLLLGPGADEGVVMNLTSGAAVTGGVDLQITATDVSAPAPPAGMPGSTGSRTDNGGVMVLGSDGISTDFHFDDWTINNNTEVMIRGDVRIQVSGDFRINNGEVLLASGATLLLHVEREITLDNGSSINPYSTRAADLVLELASAGEKLTLNGGVIAGRVHVADDIDINSGGAIYGSLISGNDLVIQDGSFHVDLDLPGVHTNNPGFAVVELRAGHGGSTQGGVVAPAAGYGDGGTSFWFDGVDDFVEVPHHPDFKIERGTVSFWFRPERLSGKQGLVSKDSSGYDQGGHLDLHLDGSTLKVVLGSKNSTKTLTASGVSVDTWHHGALVFGSGGTRLYLDGVLRDSEAYSGGLGGSSGGTGNEEPWTFGVAQQSSGNQTTGGWNWPFQGRIDDIRMYSTRLSETQLAELMSGTTPSAEADPTLVEDRSGYGIPAHLFIKDLDRVDWIPGGGVHITNSTSIESPNVITKVSDAVNAAGSFSLVIDYEPGSITKNGDQDLVSYQSFAGAANQENVEIEQRKTKYNVKTRRAGGYKQVQTTNIVTGGRQVLVVTHDGVDLKFYVDGGLQFTTSGGGAPSWYDQGGIGLGAEAYKYNEPFTGRLYRVAFYDGALSEAEVQNNYAEPTFEAGEGMMPARWDWDELD
ncbi:MAG: LamG domain-containing protein [Phycisphaeraceae bacterium]